VHRLLQRQLRRFLGSDEEISEELQRFVQAVDAAYTQADDDRALLEHSLELTSQELLERNEQLRQQKEKSEQMVSERTAELEQLVIQLQIASEVARDATTTQNLDELFTNAVELVRSRFGFYHTAIYLTDDRQKSAILMAATGKVGQKMLAEELRLTLDESSLFSQAIISGNPKIALAADKDEEHLINPMLPETRSEIALPLRVDDQINGILNIHSREESAFDSGIVPVLQTLADQLAAAISNTRLLREMVQTLRESEAATISYTQKAWQNVLQRSGSVLGFRYRGIGIEPITDGDPQGEQVPSKSFQDDKFTKLSVPIRVREQVIGTLNLQIEEDQTLPETTALTESVAERMALALESARLFEETRQLADQERFITQITDKMQYTTTIDDLIQQTFQDLYSALSASHIVVHLGTENQLRDKLVQHASLNKD